MHEMFLEIGQNLRSCEFLKKIKKAKCENEFACVCMCMCLCLPEDDSRNTCV